MVRGTASLSSDTGYLVDNAARLDADGPAAQVAGHVFPHGSRHNDLLELSGEVGESHTPLRVELGEDVVEDQYRITAARVGAQELGGREPQRQRDRPRLTV